MSVYFFLFLPSRNCYRSPSAWSRRPWQLAAAEAKRGHGVVPCGPAAKSAADPCAERAGGSGRQRTSSTGPGAACRRAAAAEAQRGLGAACGGGGKARWSAAKPRTRRARRVRPPAMAMAMAGRWLWRGGGGHRLRWRATLFPPPRARPRAMAGHFLPGAPPHPSHSS